MAWPWGSLWRPWGVPPVHSRTPVSWAPIKRDTATFIIHWASHKYKSHETCKISKATELWHPQTNASIVLTTCRRGMTPALRQTRHLFCHHQKREMKIQILQAAKPVHTQRCSHTNDGFRLRLGITECSCAEGYHATASQRCVMIPDAAFQQHVQKRELVYRQRHWCCCISTGASELRNPIEHYQRPCVLGHM